MAATADDVAPNEWECKVFIAVAEQRTYTAAAEYLSAHIRGSYGRRAVSEVMKKIEKWLKAPPFEGSHLQRKITRRGEEFLHAARTIVAEYQLMRELGPVSETPTVACLPHHVHFVARAQRFLLRQVPTGQPKVAVEYLDPGHGGRGEFIDHAVHRLRSDSYQLIIGPRVGDDPLLVSKDLYVARLEAMVSDTYEADLMPLTDLLLTYHLLLPPEHHQSRRLWEEKIVEWGADDARKRARSEWESHETATGVLRLRNEHHLAGENRAVVAPSDVALTFKERWDFGGRGANKFRWVPIAHDTGDGKVNLLEYPVSVTTKRGDAAKLFPVIDALREAVAQMPALAGDKPKRVPAPREQSR